MTLNVLVMKVYVLNDLPYFVVKVQQTSQFDLLLYGQQSFGYP